MIIQGKFPPDILIVRNFLSIVLLTATATVGRSADVDFSHEIVPVLKQFCVECHAGDKKKGSFSINTRASLLAGGENGKGVIPGESTKSEILKRITSNDPNLRMPPKGPAVPAEKIALIKAWINQGAKWDDGFTFGKKTYEPPLKPRHPELPAAIEGRFHPIDRIIDAYLAKNKQARPELIDDAGFYRRLSLDLHGLLPDPQKVSEFVRDTSGDKRAKLVKQLLSDDTAYAEHWLTFWNDLLRNDYSGTGFITGGRKQITSWLYKALIDNKPYNQMVSELVAPNGESDGFAMGIRWRGEVNSSQTVEIQYAQNVAQAFLGINLKCASCHDSFIDRWKLDEAYAIAATYSTTPLEIHRCDKPTGKKAQPAWLFPELGQINPKASQPERLKQLAGLMTHPENGRLTRTITNRFWHRLMGRGIVHPVDAMQSEPWSADLLDFLGSDLSDNRYDLKHTLELIATSQAYQMKSVPTSEATPFVFTGPIAKRMTAEQFVDTVWQLTATGPTTNDAGIQRGKTPAQQIGSVELNGRTLRVPNEKAAGGKANNPIWIRGEIDLKVVPTKPLLALAGNGKLSLFVNGQAIKDQAIVANEKNVKVFSIPNLKTGPNEFVVAGTFAGNTPVSDFYLQLTSGSNSTDELLGGGDWKFTNTPYNPAGKNTAASILWQIVSPAPKYADAEAMRTIQEKLARQRSSINLPARSSLIKSDFLTRSLGRPNRDQIVTMRPSDLTTLEAIDLANHPILADYLQRGAKNILAKPHGTTKELIENIYLSALSRSPNPVEAELAGEMLGSKPDEIRVQDLLWAIFMLPEYQLVR